MSSENICPKCGLPRASGAMGDTKKPLTRPIDPNAQTRQDAAHAGKPHGDPNSTPPSWKDPVPLYWPQTGYGGMMAIWMTAILQHIEPPKYPWTWDDWLQFPEKIVERWPGGPFDMLIELLGDRPAFNTLMDLATVPRPNNVKKLIQVLTS